MILPIFIDTRDLSEEFSLSKGQINQMVDSAIKSITLEAYNLWNDEAKKGLNSTRQRYLKNLTILDAGFMKGDIVLRMDDPLVGMLENGASPFDMKEGFEKSSKKTMKADGGWFMTIPFRFGTPSSIAESEVFSGIMPSEIYENVKSFNTDISMGSGSRSKGMKESDIPSKYQEPLTRKKVQSIPESKVFEEYKHKSSIYTGLMKVKDGSTGQSSYMSFRRVSDKSDENSWIHSGIDKGDFAQKALDRLDIPNVIDLAVDNYLSNI